ncbi:NADP-dependent oxidoreductase domain-containing protein [Bombardia bombarda]|uniref:NADP-dependent oxidoreductase domain-containing protein n=1 Tax=Bombardia bombarda TaxID=252184 RepID=A0AA40C8S9_9PEZI|nr:NADP-dependent oxidoreductase domain-containing protein [Bombardia bombarda]
MSEWYVCDAVKAALKSGYRHIDGASAYGNEEEIGEAIRENNIPREKIFVTPKLAQTWHEPADVERALDLTLRDLQLDYANLALVKSHMLIRLVGITRQSGILVEMGMGRLYPETWQAMEKLVDSGKARAIGKFQHYRTYVIIEVARRCGMTPAQVCLSWAVQKGIPVVLKSVSEEHMQQNLEVKKLPDTDFEIVDKLSSNRGPIRFLDPSRHLGFDIFDELLEFSRDDVHLASSGRAHLLVWDPKSGTMTHSFPLASTPLALLFFGVDEILAAFDSNELTNWLVVNIKSHKLHSCLKISTFADISSRGLTGFLNQGITRRYHGTRLRLSWIM